MVLRVEFGSRPGGPPAIFTLPMPVGRADFPFLYRRAALRLIMADFRLLPDLVVGMSPVSTRICQGQEGRHSP
ncbi:hypothetical protein JT06_06630 [Desulfobulbus sp. Tol-SR]|nr:hypothetical protein JT06_06630 [Desulfobulbus sp. Tol-SR]